MDADGIHEISEVGDKTVAEDRAVLVWIVDLVQPPMPPGGLCKLAMSMPKTTTRRNLLRSAAAACAVATARKAFTWAFEERKLTVHTEVAIGTVRPELHGHFIEHLGSCVYGGLWVGKGSSIPNINGHRKDAIEYLRAVGIPVLRWPGGCFADDYHWRDGIGPLAKRPKSVNLHWGKYVEDNSYGTHEFIELCRLIGAEPYLAGNVGSGAPQEMRDWMEYCNFPSGSTLAAERAANGSPEPFNVRYWGVGNENWGCGGRMTPDEYATHYRRFSTYLSGFGETRPYLIACGPSRNDTNWTRRFMEAVPRRDRIHGYAMHYYVRGRDYPTKFSVDNLREQLSAYVDMEKAVLQQRALLDSFDPERKIGLLIDEWGVWDQMLPEEEKRRGRLWMQITMRSAVAAALGLNIFHRQADKLVMGNIAQMVNVLHSLLLTEGERCVRTSTYYAFELMKPHRGKTSVLVENADASPLAVSASASRQGRELVITFVNPRHDTGVRLSCRLVGASASGAAGRVLHHDDFNACNSFDHPNSIVPGAQSVTTSGNTISLDLPPLAICTTTVQLS